MAHLCLDRDELSSILSLYQLEGLEAFGDLPGGGSSRTYWLRAGGSRYLLRLSGRRKFADLLYEKDLLLHLRDAGLPVPSVVENVASGAFTPWSRRGRYVWLFEDVGGRRLGVFEVRARHTRAVGQFLARMHLCTHGFAGKRASDLATERLAAEWRRLVQALQAGRLHEKHRASVEVLGRALAEQERRKPRGAQGVVHADLFVGNARFSKDRLTGVLDFERASTERLNLDLAVAINAWCWVPSARQRGGPAGSFSRARINGLLAGYESLLPISPQDRTELELDLRLAALRFAIQRLIEFELKPRSPVYRDYRHFMVRLEAHGVDGAAKAASA